MTLFITRTTPLKWGIDVNKLGKAEKEAIWSVAVQYGKPDVIVNAFKGYDIYKMTSEQRINRIYDYKWNTKKVVFARLMP